MSDALEQTIRSLELDFFDAVKRGPDHVGTFCDRMDTLRVQLEAGAKTGTVSQHLWSLASSAFASILSHARIVQNYDTRFDEIAVPASCDSTDVSADSIPPCPAASIPLFRYFLANICSPYPDSEEKERIAQEVRRMGWRDFDKRKLEDWLNRKRNQSGFVAILRQHCDDDREMMQRMCRTALFGTVEDKAQIPDDAVDAFEDMRELVQSQYDELQEEHHATWVDELATGVRAVLDNDCVADPLSWSLDDHDDDADSEASSDSASDWSDTDVDDDDNDDEESPRAIIGAKRKLADCHEWSPSLSSRPLSRSLSMASSISSSSTACSERSFSGLSVSSTTTVESEDEDVICDRPAKRTRNEFCAVEPSSSAQSVTAPASALFTSYRTKRKRTASDHASRSRSIVKQSRYAALGVASRTGCISDAHFSALSDICSVNWTLVDIGLSDFNVDIYSVDSTQPDQPDDAEEVALLSREVEAPTREVEEPVDLFSWSRLQVYTIFRMLLPASVRPLAPALTQSMTLSFDVNSLSQHDVTSLSELFALTPEDLAAMYESMNAVTPPLETSMPVAEDATSPTSSSSSEGSSPPALSDDSGSSTRSSSVEPSSEQDSLLMSPAELAADYSQPYNELFSGKTLTIDPSQLMVEHGGTPDVAIASHELSGAADLLSRYLLDTMIEA